MMSIEKVYLLRLIMPWDDAPEIIGIYTEDGLAKAKDVILRNRGEGIANYLEADSIGLDVLPWDREAYNREEAERWAKTPVLVGGCMND